MRRRTWDAKTKVMIVLEGLKGKPVAELCTEHQISQAQYYQWRDQFLAHAPKAFEVHEQSQREARLARENARLNIRVGELTLDDVSGDRLHGNWRGMPGAVPLPISDNHPLIGKPSFSLLAITMHYSQWPPARAGYCVWSVIGS